MDPNQSTVAAEQRVADVRQRLIWGVGLGGIAIVLLLGAFATEPGFGKVYVVEKATTGPNRESLPPAYREASPKAEGAVFSVVRTAGLWTAAFFTLCVFSYLYRDNPFYRLAEACVVGVSAGYAMVAGFWDSIIANLLVKLAPAIARGWAVPGTPLDAERNWSYVVPLILGLLLFARYVPGGASLARWPIAFTVGMTAVLKLTSVLDSDFVNQVKQSMIPLAVFVDGKFSVWLSVRNASLIASLLASMTYFIFSIEHRGAVGRVARLGVWVLMITFGASFAFTVMGRITLLTMRLQFLFDDWLWLIDPLGRRV